MSVGIRLAELRNLVIVMVVVVGTVDRVSLRNGCQLAILGKMDRDLGHVVFPYSPSIQPASCSSNQQTSFTRRTILYASARTPTPFENKAGDTDGVLFRLKPILGAGAASGRHILRLYAKPINRFPSELNNERRTIYQSLHY